MPGGSFAGSCAAFGDVEQIDMAVGADDAELAVAELDVGGGGLQQVRGDLLALVDDLAATPRAAPSRRRGARASRRSARAACGRESP